MDAFNSYTNSFLPRSSTDSTSAPEIAPSENAIANVVNSFSDAVIRYSCDEAQCHIATSEFELVDYDRLAR